MKHLGDITKISGFGVPPVDVVIGGSPCQNLSIAGKREGLAGEQSGLFLEQIRLVILFLGEDFCSRFPSPGKMGRLLTQLSRLDSSQRFIATGWRNHSA